MMLTGATVAQFLPLLLLPVITRLYTPDEIGVFAAFAALCMILLSFMTARYEFAILLPKRETDAEQLFYLSLGIAVVTTIATLLIIIVWGNQILNYLDSPEYLQWLYLVPVSILGYSIFSIGSYYLNRYKKYRDIAYSKISQATGMSTAQVTLGYLDFTRIGMIVGKVFGDILIALTIIWQISKVKYAFRAGISLKRIRTLAWRYRSFPFYNAPHAFFNSTSNNIAVLVYTRYFDEAVTGFYAVATRLTFGPIQLITKSLAQVFSREVAEKYNRNEDIYSFFSRTVGYMALAGTVPCIIGWIISPDLFAFILGHEWRITGEIVRLILPWVYLLLVVSPVTFIPILLNRQRKAMIIDFIYMLLRFIALYAGVYYNNIYIAIISYSIIGVVVQLYLLLWIRTLAKNAYANTNPYIQ